VSSLTEAFNQRSELQQIEDLSQTTAQLQEQVSALPPIPAPFDPTGLKQQIQQLQAYVSSLTEAFNQRSELQQIEQLSQTTTQVQQLISALPPIPAPFDPTGLEEQIQQLQACVSSLTEAFNQRSELQQIEQLSQTTTQLQQHVSALPPYFDTSDLKQEIQQIRAELQSLRQQVQSSTPPAETVNGGQTGLAHPELNGKLARLPQLFKSFAQMQHQLVELQQGTAKSDRTTVPPQEQLSELSPITHRVASSNGTQLTTSLKNQRLSVEALMAMAEARGIGKEFQMVIQAAKKHHLTLNLWPTNLMISPAAHLLCTARRNSSQCLFIISGQPAMDGKVRLWVSTHAIAEFYPVRQQTVTSLLGFDGWREMDKAQIEEFVASLNRLFEEASVSRTSSNGTGMYAKHEKLTGIAF
jgi:predicted outer membrane protein